MKSLNIPQKIAINGFGRIGRCVLRAYFENYSRFSKTFTISLINSINVKPKDVAYYTKYDSTYGVFPYEIDVFEKSVDIIDKDSKLDKGSKHRHSILIESNENISSINWSNNQIDLVLECSGMFTKKSALLEYFKNDVKKVLVSAPCNDADSTIILGVNDSALQQDHNLISLGSCTTNCFIPILRVLNESIGIEWGFMTTIHAYTNDQKLLDGNHQDKRRSRAANSSMIPTKTGVASLIAELMPDLKNKIGTSAIRVPVSTVSLIEFKFISKKDLDEAEINNIIKIASKQRPDIIGLNFDETVSIDFSKSPHSAIFDMTQTSVIGKRFCRIAAWYDNEWGFANRMLELCELISSRTR